MSKPGKQKRVRQLLDLEPNLSVISVSAPPTLKERWNDVLKRHGSRAANELLRTAIEELTEDLERIKR